MPFDISELDADAALLVRAKGFLQKGWCRNAQGRRADGRYVDPESSEAVSWCAYGALVRAGMKNGAYPKDAAALRHLMTAIGYEDVGPGVWNNSQKSVEPILKKFDEAISIAVNAHTMDYEN